MLAHVYGAATAADALEAWASAAALGDGAAVEIGGCVNFGSAARLVRRMLGLQ
jgi:hypothetical protein